jgi:outer membrane protein assembly factor BamB
LSNDWRYIGGGEGVVYAIKPDGTLLWMRHQGSEVPVPAAQWTSAKVVRSGWNRYVHVFAGAGGVLYAVEPDGRLVWWLHQGYRDGSAHWSAPSVVGRGWARYKSIVSGGDGDIYALDVQNRLLYLRHLGYGDGSDRWGPRADLGHVGDARALFAFLPVPSNATLR